MQPDSNLPAVGATQTGHLTANNALYDMRPRAMVAAAAEMAEVLAEVITKQKLYETIQGKRHVKVDGWLTLGTMLGVSAREVSCTELSDGSYEAKVELFSIKTGQVIGSASALCGIEEKRWAKADRYARRSMAVTRATGKAYRNNFAWIVALAGFETTPEAEMPREETVTAAVVDKKTPPSKGFDPANNAHCDALRAALTKKGVPEAKWDEIALQMKGHPMTALDGIIEFMKAFAK